MGELSRPRVMCPQCGRLFAPLRTSPLIRAHKRVGMSLACSGSGQAARNPESDGRPLWSGQPNLHFYRNAPKETTDAA